MDMQQGREAECPGGITIIDEGSRGWPCWPAATSERTRPVAGGSHTGG